MESALPFGSWCWKQQIVWVEVADTRKCVLGRGKGFETSYEFFQSYQSCELNFLSTKFHLLWIVAILFYFLLNFLNVVWIIGELYCKTFGWWTLFVFHELWDGYYHAWIADSVKLKEFNLFLLKIWKTINFTMFSFLCVSFYYCYYSYSFFLKKI